MPPLKLAAPIVKTFELKKSDAAMGSEGTTVTIKQASRREKQLLQDLSMPTERLRFVDNPDPESTRGVLEVIRNKGFLHTQMLLAMLTMTACNIECDDGSILFSPEFLNTKPHPDEIQFREKWGLLYEITAEEIYEKIIEVNPTFGPNAF